MEETDIWVRWMKEKVVAQIKWRSQRRAETPIFTATQSRVWASLTLDLQTWIGSLLNSYGFGLRLKSHYLHFLVLKSSDIGWALLVIQLLEGLLWGLALITTWPSSLISLYFYLCMHEYVYLSLPYKWYIHVCYITYLLLIYSPSNHLATNHPSICTSNIHPSILPPIHLPIHTYTHPSIHPIGCVLPSAKPGQPHGYILKVTTFLKKTPNPESPTNTLPLHSNNELPLC